MIDLLNVHESSCRGATRPPFADTDLSILHGLPRQFSSTNGSDETAFAKREMLSIFMRLTLICTGVRVQELVPELSFQRTEILDIVTLSHAFPGQEIERCLRITASYYTILHLC